MWNPFLTEDDRDSIRRGGFLYRLRDPMGYWMSRAFLWFCAAGCASILVLMVILGAYVNAAVLVAFWAAVYVATAWLTARSIRRL